MVPDSYHAFFEAAAGVSGALIGLLFVAISVAPERMRGREDAGFAIRAGIAFAALTNCLLVTLVALLPDGHVGSATVVFSAGGLVTCVWLTWTSVRQTGNWVRAKALVRVASLAAIFAVQLVAATHLQDRPHDLDAVSTISYLVLAGFAMAIERSWELVGASGSSLLARLERASEVTRDAIEKSAHRHPSERPGDEDDRDAPG